jgi:hypothetical protein
MMFFVTWYARTAFQPLSSQLVYLQVSLADTLPVVAIMKTSHHIQKYYDHSARQRNSQVKQLMCIISQLSLLQ